MPELGKYATEVLSAYAGSLALLIVLVGLTLHKGRKAKADLARAEAETGKNG